MTVGLMKEAAETIERLRLIFLQEWREIVSWKNNLKINKQVKRYETLAV